MVPTTGSLAKVDVWAQARVSGGPPLPSDTTVQVFAVSGGLPTGAALATSQTVTVALIGAMHSFNFPTPATLTAGTTYALVVTVTGVNELNVGVKSADVFTAGSMIWGPTGSMTVNAGQDLTFQAFISP